MQGPTKKAKKGIQSYGSLKSWPSKVGPINFVNTSNVIQVSWPHRWAYMYEYIEMTTKTTKIPPQVVRTVMIVNWMKKCTMKNCSDFRGPSYI